MDVFVIISLIALGISLIVVEIVFVPGTTVVGIAGFLFGAYGVYLSFEKFGQNIGIATALGAVSLGVAVTIYALKSKAWERFSLNEESNSRFNDEYKNEFELGDIGVAQSSLKPYGKAIFNEKVVEVKSNEGYIAEKSELQITKIDNKQITVKSK